MFAARAASTAAWRLLAVAQQQQQPTRRRMAAALSVHAFHNSTSEPAAGRRGTPRPSKTAAKHEGERQGRNSEGSHVWDLRSMQ